MSDAAAIDYDGLIPNNVGLAQDQRVRRALETWHPGYLRWFPARSPSSPSGGAWWPPLVAHKTTH